MSKDTPYFRIAQIAERYGITRQAVYKWTRTGKLGEPHRHPVDQSRYWLESELPPLPSVAKVRPEGQWE